MRWQGSSGCRARAIRESKRCRELKARSFSGVIGMEPEISPSMAQSERSQRPAQEAIVASAFASAILIAIAIEDAAR